VDTHIAKEKLGRGADSEVKSFDGQAYQVAMLEKSQTVTKRRFRPKAAVDSLTKALEYHVL
jgi:hypothetical protein